MKKEILNRIETRTDARTRAGSPLTPRETRYREAAGTAIRVLLLLAGLLAVMMLMSESEELSLGRFIAQKAGGLALLIGVRLGWLGTERIYDKN